MSTFTYEAYDKDGATVRGEFEALNKKEVIEYLLHRSLQPLAIDRLHQALGSRLQMPFFSRLSTIDILFLIRNLATTIKAGLTISESLDILIADIQRPALKEMLEKVRSGMQSGLPLSKTFEPYRRNFPAAFIGLLKAGEISGQLDKTLDALALYVAKEHELRQKVVSAMIYPGILLCASAGVVTLLLTVVLPRLTQAFASSGVELPLITRFFIGLSGLLTFSYLLDGIVLAAIIGSVVWIRKTDLGHNISAWILSRVPVVKDLTQKVALIRFTRTLGNLIASGISAIEALEVTADSVASNLYKRSFTLIVQDIEHGVPLSRALEKHPRLFPKILVSLTVVGERTGSLGSMYLSLADFYDDEVSNRLKSAASVIEPVLLLIMGLIVGAIALSILLPIYKLVGSFS